MGQPAPESKNRWLEDNRHKRPEINKNSRLRLFYGISPEQYNELIESQDNKCAICGKLFGTEKSNTPHIDHDHNSRWVRGALCTTCNSGIGMFKDDINLMNRAIDYIIATATPTEFTFTPVFKPKGSMKGLHKLGLIGNTNGFKKGIIPWNKGKTYMVPWNKDKKMSEEARLKMSIAARNRWSKNDDTN